MQRSKRSAASACAFQCAAGACHFLHPVTRLHLNMYSSTGFLTAPLSQMQINEPLSFLQRLTEDYENSALLDEAAAQSADQWKQMTYVAAFAVSSYANTPLRTFKPFSPLLCETYECDRTDDLGWKSITEQVEYNTRCSSGLSCCSFRSPGSKVKI